MIRRAVIDIGTNSVKLLVADVTGEQLQPVWEGSKQTRLGRGFYPKQQLGAEAIALTTRAVADFAALAHQHGAGAPRIIATSAVRDAVNAAELVAAIKAAAALPVEIISGELEADLVFEGVTTDPRFAEEPLLLLDVGGGSTEFILGQHGHKHFRGSFPLGSVRLMETLPHGDPPTAAELASYKAWVKDFLAQNVQPQLQPAWAEVTGAGHQLRLVGVGGTASILGCIEARLEHFDRARLEATRLRLDQVQTHVRRLWSLPLDERKKIVGLPANRADVILAGSVIYESVMELLGFTELSISTRGLRFAAVLKG